MAECQTATAPDITGPKSGGRNTRLLPKLHPPGPRPDFLPRPRLAERLDEALSRGLVLVCAPAGYGKTSLLASWARHSRNPVAWLSLDASDNDPARFWRHAVAALDAVYPGIGERGGPLLGPPAPPRCGPPGVAARAPSTPGSGERVAPLLGPPAPHSFEGLVTALINELAARSGPGGGPLGPDAQPPVG